eukprot:6201148-Alexandrium_andersonii.AAC.1
MAATCATYIERPLTVAVDNLATVRAIRTICAGMGGGKWWAKRNGDLIQILERNLAARGLHSLTVKTVKSHLEP